MDLNEVLKALADPNRLKILNLLHGKTLCVCDIEAAMNLSQSNLSHQLAKLKKAGLVTNQKKGLFIYYSRARLEPPYGQVIEALYGAMAEDPVWSEDQKKLLPCQECH